jgi:hypothetical protein
MGIEKYDELAQLVREARTHFEELQAGKKIAAVRARKALQNVKRVAQECRVEVQQEKAKIGKDAGGS